MNKISVRMATIEDAKAIYDIYEPYILNTVITFEYDKVPMEIFEKRMEAVMDKFPWLICSVNGEIAGYAYCSPHLSRAAFGWDCECSVYLSEKYHKMGIGTALYISLFQIMDKLGYYNIYSLICVPHESSVALHKKYGFHEVGTYYNTAYKHGSWRHLLVMEKKLKETKDAPVPVMFMSELQEEFLNQTYQEAEEYIKHKWNKNNLSLLN